MEKCLYCSKEHEKNDMYVLEGFANPLWFCNKEHAVAYVKNHYESVELLIED